MQDIVLISIPESTIRNIVEQAVRKVFESIYTNRTGLMTANNTRQEAADLAGVCITTIDNKVNPVLTRSTVRRGPLPKK
ncbi:MAG: hypothetical protein R2792_04215 [Saprospiraceae bacterium]